MPQRFLRPGITNSERWNTVSFEAQSLFIRILTLVDDFGRYDARIAILHGQCFALRNDIKPQRTAAMRSELQRAKLIDVYEVDGREYLQVEQWQERARQERSKFPDKLQVVDISTPAANGSDPLPNPASIDHRPSTISPSTIDPIPSPSAHAVSEVESFARFWEAYPRKEGKGKAEHAWKTLKCSPLIDKILAAVERYKHTDQWRREAGQYIPHPTTWLNGKRWEDEPKPSGNGSGSTGIRENIKPNIITCDDE